MRRAILFAALCLGIAAAQTPTITQNKANGATTGSSVTVTFTSAVIAGHSVYVCGGANIGATFSTPTMTGETFTKVNALSVSDGVASQLQCYKTASAVGGQTVITFGSSGCPGCGIHAHAIEVSCAGGCIEDATGTITTTVSGTPSVSTSGSAAGSNDLLVSWWYDDDGQSTFTPGSGYSTVDQTPLSNGNTEYNETKNSSASGVQTATITNGNAGDRIVGNILALQATGCSGTACRVKSNVY